MNEDFETLEELANEIVKSTHMVVIGPCPEGWCVTLIDHDHEGNQDEYDYTGRTLHEAVGRAVGAIRMAGEVVE